MSVSVLKNEIKQALNRGSVAEQTTDNEIDVASIRESTADDIAKAVQKYMKTSLNSIISAGVTIPQDGGVGLKSTMQAQINNI